ncbi:hypothetical protein TKK_0012707 [Trichogramma kaykai]
MLRTTVGHSLSEDPITLELLDAFKEAILRFKISRLKKVKLYHINHIILKVACVEYLLYPNKDNEEYKKIYSCDEQKVTEVYNKLLDLPEDNIPDDETVYAAKCVFNCDILVDDNVCLETIRLYLRGIDIDSYRELKYIKDKTIDKIDNIIYVHKRVNKAESDRLKLQRSPSPDVSSVNPGPSPAV